MSSNQVELLTKKEVRKKYSWDRKKKVDQKYVEENGDYTMAEDDKEDFQKFLFELATDAKKLNEITKPVEETPQREETPAKWYQRGGYLPIWGSILAIGAAAVAIFWNKIKSWWDGSAEEEGGGVTETEKEIEGEEDDGKE